MAEAGTPQPDGPRSSSPRTRGDRGRDPVALAAWRRVAEQRRRAADRDAPDDDVSAIADAAVSAAPEPAAAAAPEPAAPEPAAAVPNATAGHVEDPADGGATGPSAPGTPELEAPVARDEAAGTSRPDDRGRSDAPGGRTAPDDAARVGHGDEPPSGGRLHDVLLGLAGRLDDDALTSVREMVAAEDDAEAAELLGGSLLAGGVGLTADERAVLRPWFTAARVDPELVGLLPADAGALSRSVHRFAPTAGNQAPGLPLARAARRLPGVVAVRESWRVTPAGSAPGPVPHRVVLVETAGPDDCDHVVHHLAHAARSLDDTSVEVFASGAALPAYHREALAAARPLVSDEPAAAPAPAPTPPPVERPASPPFGAAGEDEAWQTVADSGSDRPSPAVGHPDPDDEEPGLEDLDEEPVGSAPTVPAEPAVGTEQRAEPTEVPTETSIDDDLTSTARRIAALWARPAPEDFSAPLPEGSLEPARLEPDAGEIPSPGAPEDGAGDAGPPGGRHGLPSATDLGTTSFRSPRARTNGHHVDPVERIDDVADTASLDGAEPPTVDEATTGEDAAQVQRARHSRAHGTSAPDDAGPARFGHDARFGAGPGPAWPGGPVTGDSGPGPDTLFASPVEVGEGPVTLGTNGHRLGPLPPASDDEPITLGTNGHRHEPTAGPHDEPATGPVAWSGPAAPPHPGPPAAGPPMAGPPTAGPHVVGPPAGPPAAGPHPAGPPPAGPPAAGPPAHPPAGPGAAGNGVGPRRPGDPGDEVAPPWASANGAGWPSEALGWTPAADGGPVRPPEAENTAAWSPDLDDSVAQLSDRERELLARLHEELAQRERAEGADPFAGPARPPSDPQTPPQAPGGPGRPRPGPPGGRVNGHGLPDSPDDAGA